MRDAHGAVRLVDILSAVSGSAVDVDAQIIRIDPDIHILRFGQYGNRRRRGLAFAVALRHGDALHAMHAAFIFQPAERALARDHEHGFLDAAQLGHVCLEHFGLVTVPLGIAHVHPHEHRRRKAPPLRRPRRRESP